jgi:hypothetical protein
MKGQAVLALDHRFSMLSPFFLYISYHVIEPIHIFPFSVYVGDICDPKDTTEVRGPTWVDFLFFFPRG